MSASRRRLPAGFAIAALLALVTQLGASVLAPVADAREQRHMPVHVEGPNQHHHAHNALDCAFCISIQSGGVPARTGPVIPPRAVRRATSLTQPLHSDSRSPFRLHSPRAPPRFI